MPTNKTLEDTGCIMYHIIYGLLAPTRGVGRNGETEEFYIIDEGIINRENKCKIINATGY
jgi:hypothetical protein